MDHCNKHVPVYLTLLHKSGPPSFSHLSRPLSNPSTKETQENRDPSPIKLNTNRLKILDTAAQIPTAITYAYSNSRIKKMDQGTQTHPNPTHSRDPSSTCSNDESLDTGDYRDRETHKPILPPDNKPLLRGEIAPSQESDSGNAGTIQHREAAT